MSNRFFAVAIPEAGKIENGMVITINQQEKEIPEATSVKELLNSLYAHAGKGMAVAVNATVIPKNNWPETRLQPGDEVLVITATQGG